MYQPCNCYACLIWLTQFPTFCQSNLENFNLHPSQVSFVQQRQTYQNQDHLNKIQHTQKIKNNSDINFQIENHQPTVKKEFKRQKNFPPKNKRRRGHQKDGRNTVSNILRNFFIFLKSEKSKEILQRINQQHNTCTKISQIMLLLQKQGIYARKYIKLSSIKKIITESKSQIKVVLAILLKIYLNKYARIHFLVSKKVMKDTRGNILKQIRKLESILQSNFDES